MFFSQPFLRVPVGFVGDPVQQMSVDFFKTPIVKLLDDRQIDVLKGNDICLSRSRH